MQSYKDLVIAGLVRGFTLLPYIVNLQKEAAALPTLICPWDIGFCKDSLPKLRGTPEASLRARAITQPQNRSVDQSYFSKCYFL